MIYKREKKGTKKSQKKKGKIGETRAKNNRKLLNFKVLIKLFCIN